MVKSNLKLFSNIYPWKGRWKDGDQEFAAKIWDDKALSVLKVAAQKKEICFTRYQEELYQCTIQCPRLPAGERPWGWIRTGETACFCRKSSCSYFSRCRSSNGDVSQKEKEIWYAGNQEGLAEFEKTWQINNKFEGEKREIADIDLIRVFGGGEYEKINTDRIKPFDPNIATGYPDDEEYE